ncbi:ShlB/FhaC/HecB family hemolysin secretion/activation protein [Vacuolonema iberomarrocanum]|uniref:ShlB/FhaC/HecB family hemolysin secretion/activation protein n=1 Tax=Vacuolonema iberomarrocanum TaxID=3454632 RepID=UPI003F6DBCB0
MKQRWSVWQWGWGLGLSGAIALLPAIAEGKSLPDISDRLNPTAAKSLQPSGTGTLPQRNVDLAQNLPQPGEEPTGEPTFILPDPEPLPEDPLPSLPPPEELLPTPEVPTLPGQPPEGVPELIQVDRYEVQGSTIFDEAELAEATAPFTGSVTFTELLQARAAVTRLYTDNGYLTSGALIPPQTVEDNVVIIQVVEGRLEDIDIEGNRRLNDSYIRSRLRLAGRTPLNVPRLLEGLQLLQLDPLLETISADLQAGVDPGTNRLVVSVAEADSFSLTLNLDNERSPSVGSVQRGVTIEELNLTGLGDRALFEYTNTDGSNSIDASYRVPFNPRNGTIELSFGLGDSDVIEEPFDVLEIDSDSRYYELAVRQPLFQSPTQEFALDFAFSRQESQTELGIADIGPFPLSPGADDEGRTRISALRFGQDWVQRSSLHVLAGRSQFNVGVDLFDPTINENAPDSRFFSWRGQGQWVRLLGRDTLLFVRGDVQLTGDSLPSFEQIGLGGQATVRGYRQNELLTDNGALISAEVRIPVLRVPAVDGILQVAPFVEGGVGWNNDTPDPDPNSLVGLGLGLLWRMGENFTARFDWGIPLVDTDTGGNSWQEDGFYFSIRYSPF